MSNYSMRCPGIKTPYTLRCRWVIVFLVAKSVWAFQQFNDGGQALGLEGQGSLPSTVLRPHGYRRDRVGFGVRTKSTFYELGNMYEISGLNYWASGDKGTNGHTWIPLHGQCLEVLEWGCSSICLWATCIRITNTPGEMCRLWDCTKH